MYDSNGGRIQLEVVLMANLKRDNKKEKKKVKTKKNLNRYKTAKQKTLSIH